MVRLVYVCCFFKKRFKFKFIYFFRVFQGGCGKTIAEGLGIKAAGKAYHPTVKQKKIIYFMFILNGFNHDVVSVSLVSLVKKCLLMVNL